MLLLTVLAAAQSDRGSISGVVRDRPGGATVKDVTVAATGIASVPTRTDSEGRYPTPESMDALWRARSRAKEVELGAKATVQLTLSPVAID